MAFKTILMIVGDFAEDYEVMVPFQALVMVGHQVDVVCPEKKAGDRVNTAIHDLDGDQADSEKPGHLFTLNADFAALDPQHYDALLLPGGRAPATLRLNPRVLEIVQYFAQESMPIASIGHGAQILAAAGVLSGRYCGAHPAVGPEVTAAGGHYMELGNNRAHVDGNLITAAAWPAQSEWLARFLGALETRIAF